MPFFSEVDRAPKEESTGCRVGSGWHLPLHPLPILLLLPNPLPLPFLPLPQIISLRHSSSSIMQWSSPARWTTSPYYALVVLVIACGGIPKGELI